MKELLRGLAQRGKTVVLASDSLAETKDVCSRLAVFHAGSIGAVGTVPELLAAPDAVSFLGPVLPPAMARRVLDLIREEIDGNKLQPYSVQPAPSEHLSGNADPAGGELAHLTRETASTARANQAKIPSDAIDHEQLEKLTKPAASEYQP